MDSRQTPKTDSIRFFSIITDVPRFARLFFASALRGLGSAVDWTRRWIGFSGGPGAAAGQNSSARPSQSIQSHQSGLSASVPEGAPSPPGDSSVSAGGDGFSAAGVGFW